MLAENVLFFCFIRGLTCPSQCSDIINSNLDFFTTFFWFLVVTLAFKKIHISSIGLEIGPQSAFRTLLPYANYSAGWPGQVWQSAAASNGRLVHFFKIWSAPNSHYSLQRVPKPNPVRSNLKKVRQMAGCYPDWRGCTLHSPLKISHRFFSRANKPSEDIIRSLFLMNMKGSTLWYKNT